MRPFFDPSAGLLYNFQSVLMLVIPFSDMWGLFLSWYSYNLFPTSLWDEEWGDEFEEAGLLAGLGNYGSQLLERAQALGDEGTYPARTPPTSFRGTPRRLSMDEKESTEARGPGHETPQECR